jgi:hypothetical protein
METQVSGCAGFIPLAHSLSLATRCLAHGVVTNGKSMKVACPGAW